MLAEMGNEMARQTLYLMAISAMIGSLFTIFILVILDMLRVARESRQQMNDELFTLDDQESDDNAQV